jgi:hypothetical protein
LNIRHMYDLINNTTVIFHIMQSGTWGFSGHNKSQPIKLG